VTPRRAAEELYDARRVAITLSVRRQ
jgi:hypothetical protein